jgi:hypothetical protein
MQGRQAEQLEGEQRDGIFDAACRVAVLLQASLVAGLQVATCDKKCPATGWIDGHGGGIFHLCRRPTATGRRIKQDEESGYHVTCWC